MTVVTESAVATQAADHRADGVELIGEMVGSGYRVPPSLVRRADGQTIQLTPLLYSILREIDGDRTPTEVAAAVSASTGRTVSEDNIRQLVDHKLRPQGLVVLPDGSQPQLKKRTPLLGLHFRRAVTDPDRTRRLTDPFRFLFRPWMVVPVLAAFAVVCWWVSFRKGLAAAAYDAFDRPGLLILVFAVTVISAGFHEFGHAAAARYGGATPGVMGFGLYLLWPAFYTDVTDSYRLRRSGRLRTDLGGLYFNAIVAVAITGLWLVLRYDALLLVVATQIIQMIRQLTPLVRFDGYHVLADLTGVPDLYGRIKPTLVGMLPWRWRDPQASELKWWARIVVTAWVIVVIPLLIGMITMAVLALPRLLGSAWAGLNKQQDVLATAWADGDMVQATARSTGDDRDRDSDGRLALYVVPDGTQDRVDGVAGYGRKAVTAHACRRDRRRRRGGHRVCVVPARRQLPANRSVGARHARRHHLRAAGRNHRGTPSSAAEATQPVAASTPLSVGQRGVMSALWDTRTPPPTVNSPQLAVILIPRQPELAVANGGGYIVRRRLADVADGPTRGGLGLSVRQAHRAHTR